MIGIAVLLASLTHLAPDTPALEFFDPPKLVVWNILLLGILAGSVISRKGSWSLTKPLMSLGILLGWILLRSLLRPQPWIEVDVLFAWQLPLLFLAAGLVMPRVNTRLLGRLLLCIAGIQAVLMLGQYSHTLPLFQDTLAHLDTNSARMIGTVGYHNQAADFLALCLLAYLASRPPRIGSWGLALIGWVVIGMTGSRGGFLAYSTALGVAAVQPSIRAHARRLHPRRASWIILVMLALLAAGFFLPGIGTRLRRTVQQQAEAPGVASRILMTRVAWDMIEERPVTGWGSGAYAHQYLQRLADRLPPEKDHALLQTVEYAREAHNDAVQFTAEYGLAGLILLLVLIGTCAAAGPSSRPARAPGWAGPIAVYILLKGLVSFPWHITMCGPLAGLLLGIAMQPSPGERTGPRRGAHPWRIATPLIMLALFSSGFALVRSHFNQCVYRHTAEEMTADSPHTCWFGCQREQAFWGALLARQGRLREAEEVLHAAHTRHVSLPLINNLANTLTRQAKWNEALPLYTLWKDTGLLHREALHNYSIASEQTGAYLEAATSQRRIRVLWHQASEAELLREAFLYMSAGAFREAHATVTAARQAFAMQGRDSTATLDNAQAAIYLHFDQLESAEKWLSKALAKNPALPSATLNWNLLKEKQAKKSAD